MVQAFYTIQTGVEKFRISLVRNISHWILLTLARIAVPFYYEFSPTAASGVRKAADNKPQVILSLTSFPPRMNKLWMVLESLLRQSRKPDRIILWLARSQFPSIEAVEPRVRAMEKRGLEIRFCEDLRSHKKYYFAMREFPDAIVITADDDIFYPENMIEGLLAVHAEHPGCVACYRAHKMTFSEGRPNKYSSWKFRSYGIAGPADDLVATGAGGVLYPPGCLNSEVFNRQAIRELCPTADDLWLKCMEFINGTQTVKVFPVYSDSFTTRGSYDTGLAKSNEEEGLNDVQLANIITRYAIDFNRPAGRAEKL